MRILRMVPVFLIPAFSLAEGPLGAPAGPSRQIVSQPAPRAWLGFDLTKADKSLRVHLPSLPEGIGFIVRSLEDEGPAQAAGLAEYDVVWKLNDQLLVNEAQLATLLRLYKPGDGVKLMAFRAGKHMEFEVTLGKAPDGRRMFPSELVEAAVLPNPISGPVREMNIGEKTARYSTDEGSVKVWSEGGGYRVRIDDAAGNVIHEGMLGEHGVPEAVPDEWQRRVMALRRGLDHALKGKSYSGRAPRPRVVSPPRANRE